MILFLLLASVVPDTLTADEVVRKAVERAAWAEAHKVDSHYVWTRHSVHDELDSNGTVKTHDDRLVQLVPLTADLRTGRLITKNGKPPTDADRQAEREREKNILAGNGPRGRPPAKEEELRRR